MNGSELTLRRATLWIAGAFLAACSMQRAAADDGWSFSASPYLWAAGLDGDVRIGRLPTATVDLSFGDVLGDLNGAFMLTGEARRGPFLLEADVTYVSTVSKQATPGPVFSSLRFENDLLVLTALGGYRLVDRPDRSLDLVAGLRRWSLDGDLALFGAAAPTVRASRDKSWIDPIVGARAAYGLSERWSLALRGTVGGFGVGADLDWGAMAAATYRRSENLSFTAGYRHLAVDYDESNLLYDVALTGPIVGLSYRF